MNKTPLYQNHLNLKAKMVDFSGWDMPLSYRSQLEEHMAVRTNVGIFDVSHMTVFSLSGDRTEEFLSRVFANDIAKIKNQDKALYGVILNPRGGIIDDLIIYRSEGKYWIVSNCGTREKNTIWFNQQAKEYSVTVSRLDDFCILALQGPKTNNVIETLLGSACSVPSKPFAVQEFNNGLVAKTGYTGEDGFEFIVPKDVALDIWDKAIEIGVQPIGLAARDTLRLEAGLNLYGNDMDENCHPFESGLTWTVDLANPNRAFIGREALEKIDQKLCKKLTGVILHERGVLRPGYKIKNSDGEGIILSGSFSPVLQKSIGLARIDPAMKDKAVVVIRDKEISVDLVSSRFLKQDKINT
ncbi:MAG: glycine cleavage system aminomethyltransferase GcvT [Gammaproteobacteria bacterium]